MKWQALLLSIFAFAILAAAGPDDCGDPMMPPPVKKISCGTFLEDLGCKWEHDFINCVQQCRRQKGKNRLIYHNHRYYDISVAEYDEIMKAEEKQSACASSESTVTATTTKTVAAIEATKKAGQITAKKTAFGTVFRTVTRVARQPSVETGLAATQTSSDLWWTYTKAIGPSATTEAARSADEDDDSTDDEDKTSHPRLDLYCAKTSQVVKCRVKCG